MRKPKIRELGEAIKSLILGPATHPFPKKPSLVPEGFRGRPVLDEDYCVACGACAMICPGKALSIEEKIEGDKGTRQIKLDLGSCVFCGQCERHCIADNKGITLTQEYNLATSDPNDLKSYIEKSLVFCEVCGDPITTIDHIRWIVEKVGTAVYGNPTLFLPMLGDLSLVDRDIARSVSLSLRSDRIRVLCAEHRRATTFEK